MRGLVRRCCLLACGVVFAGLFAAGVPAARTDGDPASDFLVGTNVFLPLTQSPSNAPELSRQVAAVYAAGFRIKVAVIATRRDLGAIPSLFGRPSDYAAFLGDELSGIYVGPLLVVMPSGYGIYDGGRTTAAEQTVLTALPSPVSALPDKLVSAAANAVAQLLQTGALRSADILPPFVQALSAVANARVLRVQFYLADDSGHGVGTLTLSEKGLTVLTVQHVPAWSSGWVNPQSRRITLPARLGSARLTFCVTAIDPAGNRSGRSCRPVTRRNRRAER